MSYAKTMILKKGGVAEGKKYQNSHGFPPRIWGPLFEKYVPKKHPYDNWLCDEEGRLWRLADDDRLTDMEKRVLTATFDRHAVKFADLKKMAEDFRAFSEMYPSRDGQVCHLAEIADELDTIHNGGGGVVAVGWHGTSLSENLWNRYDGENDTVVEYDISTEKIHAFVGFGEDTSIPCFTDEEVRKKFLDHIRHLARHWADLEDKTKLDALDGLAFSILNIFDGTTVFPAMDIVLRPHEEDKDYCIEQGERWYQDGMVINECHLHDEYYEK